MSDTVTAALITVGGMLSATTATAVVQLLVTRFVIQSETKKILTQITTEADVRRADKKCDRLLDTVSELVAVSDPELSLRIDYTRAVTLIHRARLLLDLSIAPEKTLNGLLNQLGLAIQERLTTEGEPRGGALDGKIMQAQAQVIDRTKDVISHCTSKV